MHDITTTSRRGFVGMAGAAAVAGAWGFAACRPVQAAELPQWDVECDVLIAGSGSGASAAILDVFDAGDDLLVIEKQDWLGGTMRRSGGGIAAPCTCVQKALGVEDNVDDFYEYLVACGEGFVDSDLLRVFADRASADFDWVVQDLAGQTEADWDFCNGVDGMEIAMQPGLNLSGTPVYFEDYGFKPVPRCYWFAENPDDIDPDGSRVYCTTGILGRPETDVARGGTGLWKPFQDAIDERGVNVRYKTALKRFVTNDNGEVVGAICDDIDAGQEIAIKARKGIILATGTWTGNKDLCANLLMEVNEDELWALPDMSRGEGVVAAMGLGAATVAMAAGAWAGGLKVDANCQVQNVFGEPIPRLYASSYAVGGKKSVKYPNCGLHNMWNLSLGRVAAEQVCALEPWE